MIDRSLDAFTFTGCVLRHNSRLTFFLFKRNAVQLISHVCHWSAVSSTWFAADLKIVLNSLPLFLICVQTGTLEVDRVALTLLHGTKRLLLVVVSSSNEQKSGHIRAKHRWGCCVTCHWCTAVTGKTSQTKTPSLPDGFDAHQQRVPAYWLKPNSSHVQSSRFQQLFLFWWLKVMKTPIHHLRKLVIELLT